MSSLKYKKGDKVIKGSGFNIAIDSENVEQINMNSKSNISDNSKNIKQFDNLKNKENRNNTGIYAGMICIISGVILSILGTTGSVNWNITIKGFQSELSNAAPGVVLFIVGLVIIWITRNKT